MNEPYVKQYDKEGLLINPILDGSNYASTSPNRRRRREDIKGKTRFIGNGKNFPLVVGESYKYEKVVQVVYNQKQEKDIRIEHYLLR